MLETNPLILSGEFTCVAVADLRVGDVNAFDETVTSHRLVNNGVSVTFNNTEFLSFHNPCSTILIRSSHV